MSDNEGSIAARPAGVQRGAAGIRQLRLTPEMATAGLATLTLLLGLAGALLALGQGVWLDEFWTLASGERGMTLSEFGGVMARDVHPLLHYALVYLAQAAGVVDLPALRALNLVGVPLTLLACWFAYRRGAISPAQAWVVLALYASSGMFLSYAAELRAYFLAFSSSVALTLTWRVMARDVADGRRWSATVLAFWFVCLATFTNAHYFATLLGGLLTLSLMVLRRGRGVVALALVSLAAAAPAVAMALIQATSADAGIVQWVQTGRIDGAFVIVDAIWAGMAYNVPAAGCAIVAVLLAADRGAVVRDMRDELVLALTLAAYCFILLAINVARPVIIDRYLVALGGPAVVGAALLAARSSLPRWAPAAVCGFALLVQGRAIYSESYIHPGWSTSAAEVAQRVEACPQSQVFIDPVGDTPHIQMFSIVRRYGLTWYAERYGLTVSEVEPGAALPASGACPTLIWLEHYDPADTVTGAELLETLQLDFDASPEILRVGSGVIIVAR